MNPLGNTNEVTSHLENATGLEADGYVEFFRIRMFPPGQPTVVQALTPKKSRIWQGYSWESYPISLSEFRQESSGEVVRPKLTIANANGVFSRYIHEGWMDAAEIHRYRVLKQHADDNINSFLRNAWRVGRVVSLDKTMVVLELRGPLDWQSCIFPPRAYYPPEFPSVSA